MDENPQPGPSSSKANISSSLSDDAKLAELLSGGGFAVYPLPWCPHLPSLPLPEMQPETVDTQAPCNQCGDTKENWLCLHCFQINCSRYINEHQLYHFSSTGHPLALSFSDLSVWCYECDSYVDNESLYSIKNKAHRHKFQGEEMLKPDYDTHGLFLDTS